MPLLHVRLRKLGEDHSEMLEYMPRVFFRHPLMYAEDELPQVLMRSARPWWIA